ncbi:hypothetical protein DERP_008384 [Dermatophagoides pteronyssinus]|uniref:Uncharacterized protein n=1 Tax=Dermatophagoides pteronyssinus TaxID=6956 RepID=A0ABQ8IV85_DERPT|nr:hypothetical protein DERP_008384 [Dermatophagoides pteronyssinus]
MFRFLLTLRLNANDEITGPENIKLKYDADTRQLINIIVRLNLKRSNNLPQKNEPKQLAMLAKAITVERK